MGTIRSNQRASRTAKSLGRCDAAATLRRYCPNNRSNLRSTKLSEHYAISLRNYRCSN